MNEWPILQSVDHYFNCLTPNNTYTAIKLLVVTNNNKQLLIHIVTWRVAAVYTTISTNIITILSMPLETDLHVFCVHKLHINLPFACFICRPLLNGVHVWTVCMKWTQNRLQFTQICQVGIIINFICVWALLFTQPFSFFRPPFAFPPYSLLSPTSSPTISPTPFSPIATAPQWNHIYACNAHNCRYGRINAQIKMESKY